MFSLAFSTQRARSEEHDDITEKVAAILAQYSITQQQFPDLCSKQRYVKFFELEDEGD